MVHSAEMSGPTNYTVKTALKNRGGADPLFGAMYAGAPYVACGHNCMYCDGRAEKYYIEGNFGKDIRCRTNFPDLLKAELSKLREVGTVHLSSGVTDVYQPLEAEYGLMARCAEILAESRFPVQVLTKNALVARDLPYWNTVHEKSGFLLQMTVTFWDDELRKIFEPGASSIQERLETIKLFRQAGIPVGIYMMPLLPWISDREDQLVPLIQTLRDLDVSYIASGGVTLRPGRQKELFLKVIKARFPDLYKRYMDLYSENRISGEPNKGYTREVNRALYQLLDGVPTAIPHRLYKGSLPLYHEVMVLLYHLEWLYSAKGVNTSGLIKSRSNLEKWLSEEQKIFNRRRSLPGDHIDGRLHFAASTGELERLLDNRKLTDFVCKVILERQVLDYNTLRLEER